MTVAKPELVTKSQLLKEYGWTESLIRQFLPEPDAVRPNPRFKKAAPMKLYAIARIEAVEKTAEYREALKSKEPRIAGAAKAVDTKRVLTREWLSSIPAPVLPDLSREVLTQLAIQHYLDLWRSRNEYEKSASLASPPEFLHRIAVNYLRHRLTDYELRLGQSFRRVGKIEAVECIREKIYQAIAAKFPWLADECKSQMCARSIADV